MNENRFREEVNKVFYDTVVKNVNNVAKKYTNKLHFFFDKGEKLNLDYKDGGFRPTKFYLVHNPINIYDGRNKKIYFVNDNSGWKLQQNGEDANFESDLADLIGKEKSEMFIKELLYAIKIGINNHSKILVKNKEARDARINSRIKETNKNIFESAGLYYSEEIRPNTKWGSKKDEGNGIISQETDRESSKKVWIKRFFNKDSPNYFVGLFVWGYYYYVIEDGRYKELSKEEFRSKVKNSRVLESLAKKELVTIVDKQIERERKKRSLQFENYFPY